jgi:antitoxin CcdA
MTLEEWLRESGEPIASLAIRCGVHPATVLRWKNGERRPRPRQMAALTHATRWQVRARDFGIDAHWGTPYYLSRDGEPPSPAPAPVRADIRAPLPGGAKGSGTDAAALPVAGLAETRALASEAKALGLDVATIAARAVREAIGAEKARRWAEENRAAIEGYNRYFEENDTPLAEYRAF